MSQISRQRSTLLAVLLLLGTLCAGAAWSTDSTSPAAEAGLTETQQQAASAFAKEHHPQLNSLISRLQKRDPAEYHKALSDVFKTYERLQRLEQRDPPRHEVELNLWKVESRIRLLAARMATEQRSAPESQLRELLNQRTDLRLKQLTLERERLNSRIERLDTQVSQLSSERDAMIDKEIERLSRSVRDRSSRVTSSRATEKPSARTPADATTKAGTEQQRSSSKERSPERPAKKSSD